MASTTNKIPRLKPSTALRAWARETFSRDQLISALKDLAWVAPLTIVIWVYAEREQISKIKQQPIPIAVRSTDPSLVVMLDEPAEPILLAEISGPRGQLDKVTESLRRSSENPAVLVDLNAEQFGVGGPHNAPSAALIADAGLFRGLTIDSVSPANLRFRVDRLITRDVPVTVPAGVQSLIRSAVFEPSKVPVTAPRAVFDAAEARGRLEIFADLSPFRDNQLATAGKKSIDNIPLLLQLGDAKDMKNVTMGAATVKATLEVGQIDVPLRIDAMPVYITYPPGFAERYKAEGEMSVTSVTILGPGDQIEQLQRPDFEPKPKARLEVNRSHLPVNVQRTERLIFDLPPSLPGLKIDPRDAARTIDFKLVERTTPE